ncbi:unnamed protein product [Rotaria sp. Silwood1]|nr:unnamed protein product [Rotaria sp. Silwood1]CAF1453614.1 unnamed protein product [Rotaria sp. Silwood1]CAF3539886.1 unnamed protein product [Rotaria sp. Silwood1]CAF4940647.1 unnamed protein product [Rotaria sp. Silwood1]
MPKSKAKVKRSASNSPPLESSSLPNIINGLFECYNFLLPNEYSNKTLGLLAFLLRKSVGEINFSDIMNEVEKRYQQGQSIDYITLLDDKRKNLLEIEASIEKCLMINRLISYIQENESQFISLISDIRQDMRMKLIDNQINQNIEYPKDFRQREQDILKRRHTQEIRRLFYFHPEDKKQSPSLIHLINRHVLTTKHLNYLIDNKMRYEPQFGDTGIKELERIFQTSFMITAHPHSGVNPVLIYERKGSGQCTAKVSVIIISLLYDFMQTHPKLIELYDIEPILCSSSSLYKLESSTISWKTCRLQISPNDKPQFIQYAELSLLNIQCSTKTNTRIHLGDELYSLKFLIKFRLNLNEYKFSKCYQIPLESLTFAISSHNSHIPHMLSRIILNDIRRFSQRSSVDVQQLSNFILRYFCHRIGVLPDQNLKIYLQKELNRAKNERKNFQTMEDIFMEFLVPFVNQVEFIAKHPILAMFYADGLCLGICDSERAAEIMRKSTDINSPIVGIRLNSIKVDYKPMTSTASMSKAIKLAPCAVRVDIYNDRTKNLQYRTFDSLILAIDIRKFVSTAHTENGHHIRVLSNLDDSTNAKNYKSFTDFDKYYSERLSKIYQINEDYKLITDILNNIEDENNDDDNHRCFKSPNPDLSEMFSENLHSVPPPSATMCNNEYCSNVTTINDDISKVNIQSNINQTSLQNILSTSSQQSFQHINNQDMIDYVLTQPEIIQELLNRLGVLQLSSSIIQQGQGYQNQHIQQILPTQLQMQSSYQQQIPQIQYQQQIYNQQVFQQSISIPTIHNQLNNDNQYQNFSRNNNQISSQECPIETNYENLFTESITDPLQFSTIDQNSSISIDDNFDIFFDDICTSDNIQ